MCRAVKSYKMYQHVWLNNSMWVKAALKRRPVNAPDIAGRSRQWSHAALCARAGGRWGGHVSALVPPGPTTDDGSSQHRRVPPLQGRRADGAHSPERTKDFTPRKVFPPPAPRGSTSISSGESCGEVTAASRCVCAWRWEICNDLLLTVCPLWRGQRGGWGGVLQCSPAPQLHHNEDLVRSGSWIGCSTAPDKYSHRDAIQQLCRSINLILPIKSKGVKSIN